MITWWGHGSQLWSKELPLPGLLTIISFHMPMVGNSTSSGTPVCSVTLGILRVLILPLGLYHFLVVSLLRLPPLTIYLPISPFRFTSLLCCSVSFCKQIGPIFQFKKILDHLSLFPSYLWVLQTPPRVFHTNQMMENCKADGKMVMKSMWHTKATSGKNKFIRVSDFSLNHSQENVLNSKDTEVSSPTSNS